MTPKSLVERFRRDVSDPEMPGDGDDSDSLWSDDELYSFVDDAQRDFFRRTDYKLDSTTYAALAVTTGDPWVVLSEVISRIRRAKLASETIPLRVQTLDQFLEGGGPSDDYGLQGATSWETRTGTPRVALTDMESNALRLVPTPVADDTLALMVYRLPLNEITRDSTVLEIVEPEYQRMLLNGMKQYAYMKQDADTYDEELAAKFMSLFNGNILRVQRELRRVRLPAGSVHYGGY